MQELEEKVVYSVARQDWIDGLARSLHHGLNGLFRRSETSLKVKDFLNGVWLAHPIHPAVTDLPVGAWTTALVLDGVEAATGRDMKGAASTAIGIGIAGAAASAVTGLADWSDTYGDQRRVGLIHALTNVLAVTLYGASLWRRLSGRRSGARRLSGAAYATMLVGAYLGGELVFRLGTQVDRNAYATGPEDFTPVMNETDLPEDRPTRVEAGGLPVVLVRHRQAIHALNDVCSHAGCSLAEGRVEVGTIVCGCHGSTYRLEDGTVVHGPSPYGQPHHEVRVRDGRIEVRTTLQ